MLRTRQVLVSGLAAWHFTLSSRLNEKSIVISQRLLGDSAVQVPERLLCAVPVLFVLQNVQAHKIGQSHHDPRRSRKNLSGHASSAAAQSLVPWLRAISLPTTFFQLSITPNSFLARAAEYSARFSNHHVGCSKVSRLPESLA